jgi:predicted nucleotidyltransferase component of viral defense system
VEAGVRLKRVSPDDLFLPRLPANARRAFLTCTKLSIFQGSRWYLAGGTALSLQVGHRQSVDLDFFTPQPRFPETSLERKLLMTNRWRTDFREAGTLYGRLQGAKVSFIAYPFLVPSKQRLICGRLRILLPGDIAVMKIIAISQRGRKRDFVDLFWYCTNREPLREVLSRVRKHYPRKLHNFAHILKSLTYFADAEDDPMPKLFFNTSWKAIMEFFRREVPDLARQLMDL